MEVLRFWRNICLSVWACSSMLAGNLPGKMRPGPNCFNFEIENDVSTACHGPGPPLQPAVLQCGPPGTCAAAVRDSESDKMAAQWYSQTRSPRRLAGRPLAAMRIPDAFRAFKANRRMHYQIQNAAIMALVIAAAAALLWPSCELASKIIAVFAAGVLLAKFSLQPAFICYIEEKHSSEYSTINATRQSVSFPRLYIAYTGNLQYSY